MFVLLSYYYCCNVIQGYKLCPISDHTGGTVVQFHRRVKLLITGYTASSINGVLSMRVRLLVIGMTITRELLLCSRDGSNSTLM